MQKNVNGIVINNKYSINCSVNDTFAVEYLTYISNHY